MLKLIRFGASSNSKFFEVKVGSAFRRTVFCIDAITLFTPNWPGKTLARRGKVETVFNHSRRVRSNLDISIGNGEVAYGQSPVYSEINRFDGSVPHAVDGYKETKSTLKKMIKLSLQTREGNQHNPKW